MYLKLKNGESPYNINMAYRKTFVFVPQRQTRFLYETILWKRIFLAWILIFFDCTNSNGEKQLSHSNGVINKMKLKFTFSKEKISKKVETGFPWNQARKLSITFPWIIFSTHAPEKTTMLLIRIKWYGLALYEY